MASQLMRSIAHASSTPNIALEDTMSLTCLLLMLLVMVVLVLLFVSRLPRVPGRGRLPGRSPPSFPAAPRLDVGVHGRPRNQELPAEPVRVDLSRPDEVVRLVSARPHVLLHLDHRHPFAAILVALGRGAFGCACQGSSNLPVRHRARTPHDTVCLFVCATIEPPDGD